MSEKVFYKNKFANEYNIAKNNFLMQICSSIFSNAKIKSFGYRKFYFNGSYIALCTDIKYQKLYFQNSTDLGDTFYQAILDSKYTKFTYFLWPSSPNMEDEIIANLLRCNIWNGLTIYWRGNEHIESFSFAGHVDDTNLQNYLINNLNMLKRFICYFWKNSKDIISASKSSLAYFTDYRNLYFDDSKNNLKNRENIFLTERQGDCIRLVAKGYTSKKVAQILDIAPKTVENHIIAIKDKASVNFKDELLDMYYDGKFVIER